MLQIFRAGDLYVTSGQVTPGCASLGSESRSSSSEVLYPGRWIPNNPASNPVPSPSSLSQAHDGLMVVSSFSWLQGDCPESSPFTLNKITRDCHSDPPLTHIAVGICRWKDIITGWGSNWIQKAGDGEGFWHSHGACARPDSPKKDRRTFLLPETLLSH